MSKIPQAKLLKLKTATRSAAEASSKAFSKWAKRPISVVTDMVEAVPVEEIIPRSEPLDPVSFGLYLPVSGDVNGSLLFLLREETAYRLVDSLMSKKSGSTHELGEMEKSALLETANIVGTSYINALVKEMGLKRITPGAPTLLYDITHSILGSVVMERCPASHEVLLAHLHFASHEQTLEWKLFFLADG